jgi:glycosyltransferase involved in cell wall biosynthesis
MSANRTVSVVIPCYNCEVYVGNAIESVLKQDYSPLEVVVVDDGSTDDSLQEIRKFREHVEIISTPNRGAPAARNTGLERATGSLIKFLDADDELFDGAIRRQVEQQAELGEDLVVFGEGVWFEKPDRAFRRRFRQREPDEDPLMYILRMNPQTSLSLYPRNLLERVEGFDEGLARYQDLDLNLRVCLAGAVHWYAPTDVTKVRMHEGKDRISQQGILKENPFEALNRLKKWVRIIEGRDRMSERIRKEVAQRAWSKGRAVLRAGHTQKASSYFEFARSQHLAPLSDKSKAYRVTTKLLGPHTAELIAGVARRAGLFSGNGEIYTQTFLTEGLVKEKLRSEKK